MSKEKVQYLQMYGNIVPDCNETLMVANLNILSVINNLNQPVNCSRERGGSTAILPLLSLKALCEHAACSLLYTSFAKFSSSLVVTWKQNNFRLSLQYG